MAIIGSSCERKILAEFGTQDISEGTKILLAFNQTGMGKL